MQPSGIYSVFNQIKNKADMKITYRVLAIGLMLNCFLAVAGTNETRELPSFSGIALGISAHLIVKQGSPQSVRLEGDQDDLERISTKVRGDELIIETFNGNGWNHKFGRVTIYVTVPELESIAVSGSGDVRSEGRIKSDNLQARVSGSGGIELEVEAEEMESRISGSGQIALSGNAGSSKISISGSGRLRAEDLKAKEYQIRISGSGNCRINVAERLEVDVTGSGDVYYRGDPERVYSNISGSGNLRRID